MSMHKMTIDQSVDYLAKGIQDNLKEAIRAELQSRVSEIVDAATERLANAFVARLQYVRHADPFEKTTVILRVDGVEKSSTVV